MCAWAWRKTSSPRPVSARTAAWLHMVPDGKYSAASLPRSSAACSCRARTVGSSPSTSSPTSASSIAARISGEGRVTVSLRRSIVLMGSPRSRGVQVPGERIAGTRSPAAERLRRAAGAPRSRARRRAGGACARRPAGTAARGPRRAAARRRRPGRRPAAARARSRARSAERPANSSSRRHSGAGVQWIASCSEISCAEVEVLGPVQEEAAVLDAGDLDGRRSPARWPPCPGSRPRCGRG